MKTMNPNEEFRHPPLTEEEKVIARAELERRAARRRMADEMERLRMAGLVTYTNFDEEPLRPDEIPPEAKKLHEEAQEAWEKRSAERKKNPIKPEEIKVPVRARPNLASYLEE